MVKAIFFDIDGTLYSHKTNSVPASTVSALKALQEKGILVFLATGRHSCVLEQLPQLHAIPYDGAITLNGAYCYDSSGMIYGNPIDPGDIRGLLAYLQTHPMPCGFIEDRQIYLNFHNDRVAAVHASVHTPPPELGDLNRGLEHPIYQVLLYLTDGEMGTFPPMPHCKATKWHSGGLDVVSKTSGKDVGIQKVLAHYGIDPADTMAFGDGENDIEMFHAVDIAVAMGNASDRVKAESDYVTADIDDDGIMKALLHFGILTKPEVLP